MLLTVSHDLSAGRFSNLKVFWPLAEILHVERQPISFRQRVEIHAVELEHVIANKRSKSTHFDLFLQFSAKHSQTS